MKVYFCFTLILLFIPHLTFAGDVIYTSKFDKCKEQLENKKRLKFIEEKLEDLSFLANPLLTVLNDSEVPNEIKNIITSVLNNPRVRFSALDLNFKKQHSDVNFHGMTYNKSYHFYTYQEDEAEVIEFDNEIPFSDPAELLESGTTLVTVQTEKLARNYQLLVLVHEIAHAYLYQLFEDQYEHFLQKWTREIISTTEEGLWLNPSFDVYIHERFAYEVEHWLADTSKNIILSGYSPLRPYVNFGSPSFVKNLSQYILDTNDVELQKIEEYESQTSFEILSSEITY